MRFDSLALQSLSMSSLVILQSVNGVLTGSSSTRRPSRYAGMDMRGINAVRCQYKVIRLPLVAQ